MFCEGLRPIRCRKIRYFKDRRYRKRLMPPPAVALPANGGSLNTHPARELSITGADRAQQGGAAPVGAKREEVVIRNGTVEDIERIESLTLDDFAMEFPAMTRPPGDGPMSDQEMKIRVDAFHTSLDRDRESLYGR